MADQLLFFVSFVIGIGPALLLLWHGLRRFDYPRVEHTLYDDRKVFFALAVGLVVGTMSSLFSLYMPRYDIVSALVAIAGVAFFEETFKLVYLLRKGYRMNFATTFYGFSLGLGMAATVVLAQGLGNPNLLITPLTLALLAVFSFSMCMLEATTGALIGYGCSKGLPWSYLIRALIARFFYTVVALVFLLGVGEEWMRSVSLFAALGVGVFLYYYVYTLTMPETLPPEFRRKSRKEKRARARKIQTTR